MMTKISHSHATNVASFMLLLLIFTTTSTTTEARLSSTFYDKTCPNALSTIKSAVGSAVSRERRMAASLIRLHFHDCFVQGCDASVLLNDAPTIISEKKAFQNRGSARGFEVIDDAKAKVEKICPGVVSCADILAVAARDASVAVSGPTWKVKLGRRDSITASQSRAEANLPLFTDSLDRLIDRFQAKGLNARDLVALSGAHTIGQAQCFTFRDRIYNNASDIDSNFANNRRRRCPAQPGNGDSNLAPLELVTPNSFDYNFYKNLMQKKGLLESDQVLFSGGSTDSIVSEYSSKPETFRSEFGTAMIKMGDISPLTGSAGQIRRICSALN